METKNDGQATARPWTVGSMPKGARRRGDHYMIFGNGVHVASVPNEEPCDEANAALIVRAVNAHDGLVAALRALLDDINKHARGQLAPGHMQHIRDARAALAVARGEGA